jgi:hypothetical protein
VNGAGVPLKVTWTVWEKNFPEITTVVPTGPDAGLKLVMVGLPTVKFVEEYAVPPGEVT